MKPTDQTLMEQIKITDREIENRLTYLTMTRDMCDQLVKLKPIIAGDIDLIVKEFYDYLIEYDEIAHIIGDSESLARLKKYIRRYILELFDGKYDTEYVQTRLRIGLVHKRIGVAPKFYIMAVKHLLNLLRQRLVQASSKKCRLCEDRISAVENIMLFDLTLVFDTYIHGLMEELVRGKKELEIYSEGLENKIHERTKDLQNMARIDGLTTLLNQRSFYEELRRECSRARRKGSTLSLIYFDLDGFKLVNDTYGHQKGDEILVDTAKIVRTILRQEDIPVRYGGDEFCIILPDTHLDEADQVANRLIAKYDEEMAESGVTLSIGIAMTEPEDSIDYENLVKQADAAMYRSKKQKGHAVTKHNSVILSQYSEASQDL